MQIALAEGEPAARTAVWRPSTSRTSRRRASGSASDDVEVGTVLELHGEVRLLDVFDPDGNRLQLVEDVSGP